MSGKENKWESDSFESHISKLTWMTFLSQNCFKKYIAHCNKKVDTIL